MEEHCLICYAVIPEGRQVCPMCEEKIYNNEPQRKMKHDPILIRKRIIELLRKNTYGGQKKGEKP